jgi:hypothetical protein
MNIPPTGYNQATYAPGGFSQIDGPPRGEGEPFGGAPSSPAATVEFSQESVTISNAGGEPERCGHQPGGFGGPGGPNTYAPPKGPRGQIGPPPEAQRAQRGSQEAQFPGPMID